MDQVNAAQIQQFVREHLQKVTVSGNEAKFICPYHDDHDPSASINLANGLWRCYACNEHGNIFQLAGRVLLCDFKEARRRILGESANGHQPVYFAGYPKTRYFNYEDLDGKVRFRHVRIDYAPKKYRTKKPKRRWERPDNNGGWLSGRGGEETFLYRLRDIIHAETVYIVEGEPKVEQLREWGLVATCNPDGAGKWRDHYNGYLADKHIVILPDNDPPGADGKRPGQQHAEQVANALLPIAASVKVVELPALPEKGDIVDWAEDRHTKDELLALVEKAPRYSKKPDADDSESFQQFWMEEDGVWGRLYGKDGVPESIHICGPLEIPAITRNENGDGWGRLLKWKDAENREHVWAMPMSLLAGSGEEFRARLLDGGLEINPRRAAKELLLHYVQKSIPEQKARSVTKVGWQGNVFVMPDCTIGQSKELYFYQPPAETEHNIRQSGKLEEWTEHVGKYCAGNSRLLLAVSCAFAAPLVTLTDSESGGFHFYGSSSSGKTTALVVAGSVWGGGGRNGYVESWRTTANGLEAFGEVHNEGLGCLDEIAQVDARDVTECLYMLANGQGKGRMTKNIGTRRRLTWTLLFLSSGEITLNEHAEAGGRQVKVGVEIRLVNIAADAGKGKGIFEHIHAWGSAAQLANHLKDAAMKYYGTPIRAFIEHVAKHRWQIVTRVKEMCADFQRKWLPEGAANEIGRAARRFALAAAAGEIATELGITGWEEGEATKGVFRCLANWLATREPSDIELGLRSVRQFIELHGASRFQSIHERRDKSGDIIPDLIRNRAGFKRDVDDSSNGSDEDGGTEYLIFPEVFKTEVCKGFDYTTIARALSEKGFLISDQGSHMKQIRVPEVGRARFYVVTSRILGG